MKVNRIEGAGSVTTDTAGEKGREWSKKMQNPSIREMGVSSEGTKQQKERDRQMGKQAFQMLLDEEIEKLKK